MKYIVVNCEHINYEINTPQLLGVFNTEQEASAFVEEEITKGLKEFPALTRLGTCDILVERNEYDEITYYCAWEIMEVK